MLVVCGVKYCSFPEADTREDRSGGGGDLRVLRVAVRGLADCG